MTDATTPAPARQRKKPAKNPVSAADRAIFWQHVLAWQVKLGLENWRFTFSEKKPGRVNAAEVVCYHPDRLATFRLNDDLGGTKVTPDNLEAFAIHEVKHVLLAPIVDQEASGLEGDALAAAEHQIIHTLQKLLTKGRI